MNSSSARHVSLKSFSGFSPFVALNRISSGVRFGFSYVPMMSLTTSSDLANTSDEELRRMRLNRAYAGMRFLGSLTLCSRASKRRRALSLMKSEYNCSRWKILLPSKARLSWCLWIIQVLKLESNAPTSEPKIAAKTVMVLGVMDKIRVAFISYEASSKQKPGGDRRWKH